MEWESEELMRRYVVARAAGDRGAMQDAWGGLLTMAWPRLQRLIAVHGTRLRSTTERENALSEAALRLTRRVVWTFQGTTTAAFGAMLATVAKRACQTEVRAASKRSRRERALDTNRRGEDEGADPIDVLSKRLDDDRVSEEDDREHEAELYAAGAGFLDWAIPQLTPKPRQVLELLRDCSSREEVMRRLGMSREAVDQNYSRAMKRLNELKEQYAS